MIQITHWVKYKIQHKAVINWHGMALKDIRYALGEMPANHRVPSIITETSIWRNCIMFFKDNDTEPYRMWVGK